MHMSTERFFTLDCCRWAGIVLSALLFGAIYSACTKENNFEQIRSMIERAAAMAEKHDIPGLLDLTSQDVTAMPLNLGRRGIRGVLWRAFNHYGPLTVLYPRPEIDVPENNGRASVRFPFLIVKTKQTMPGLSSLRDDPEAWIDAIGETADLYRLQLELTRQGNQWQVYQAVLERYTGLGFK